MLSHSRKKVISNVFRDTTKVIIVMLIISPLVPGHPFEMGSFLKGMVATVLFLGVAVYFASSEKEAKEE